MDYLDYYLLEQEFTEAERQVRDRVRAWVAARVRPLIESHHRAGTFPRELVREMGELGVFAPHLSGYGCAGLSNVAYGLIMQELERGDSGIRSCASVQGSLAMYALHTWGTEEQKQRWLPPLARGEILGGFALTERLHGSDPAGMETTARRDGDSIVLNGNKCWINNGSITDVLVVWAKGEDGKVGGYLVERDSPGRRAVDLEGKFSLRASTTSELFFEDCRIPAGNALPGARGMRAPLGCLSQARFGIAWGVIGAAQDCYETALRYAQERVQFDRPIAGYQLVQEKLVWMVSEITKAQLLAMQLARLKDAGTVTPAQISLAKRNNVWMALECARLARAILGGVGITDAHPVIRHMLNLETVYTYEGTHDIHTLIVGQDITGLGAFAG
jgi:glutaryl-CoA dehydrogenase